VDVLSYTLSKKYTNEQINEQKLKVAKLEQELNNYKSVMSQVNINQEATQKASGYGIISLPKNAANGQVSVGMKGLTYTNLLGEGFSNPDNWYALHAIALDNGYARFVASGDYRNAWLRKDFISLKPNTVYTIFAEVRKNTINSTFFISNINESDSFGTQTRIYGGEVGIFKFVLTTKESLTNTHYPLRMYLSNASTEGEIELRIMLLEGDYTNEHIIYINNTKSTVSAIRLKSVGKNLSELSYIDNNKKTILGKKLHNSWSLSNGMWYRENNAYHRSLFTDQVGTSSDRDINLLPKLTPNTTYFFDAVTEGNILNVALFNPDGTISGTPKALPTSLTTGNNDIYLDIRISSQASIYFKDLIISKINTPYEPYTESTQYIQAKDSEGKIVELRSLPNGTKDEVRIGEKKFIQRTKKYVLQASDIVSASNHPDKGFTIVMTKPFTDYVSTHPRDTIDGTYVLEGYPEQALEADVKFTSANVGYSYNHSSVNTQVLRIIMPVDTTLAQAQTALTGLELIYQLAEPIITPINVSGNLISYPSGTVYVENVVADAGIYTDNMEVLYSDLPIKTLEKISKVDFNTGLETELDITAAVIAEDKLSFTHPDLVDGDIVFFTYEYDRESTEGETEIEYYDSRYVIKDSVTGKFYKWKIAVANGTPTIELEEV